MTRLGAALDVLRRAIDARVTPGAQLSVAYADQTFEHHALGAFDYAPDSAPVTVDTVYDLASVTKVVTALALVRLCDEGALTLDTPIESLLPAVRDTPAAGATLEQIASHRAGLVHWAPFYRAIAVDAVGTPAARRTLLDAVARTARGTPGDVRYSDLGYMLLGEALAAASGTSLPALYRRAVLDPVGLGERITYRGVGEAWRTRTIPPTELCAWWGRVVQGEVHDENCRVLGGVAGHAGLFGRAADVCALGARALACLAGDDRWFAPPRMAWMIAARPGGAHRFGWDARSDGTPSSGTRMGPRTFGHLGFTGTSLWCDPDAGVAIALVTNRVHPTRDNHGIRALRPAVHDAVMAAVRA